ncbi:hypothetical protein XA68_16445 [Ophiocordyceps unilateralis]|uniref:Uncharacterized protein n=1 Tax=Ophiocordyceps unilateralis TaxID=268505 RepID=A0A2A9PKH0_OPHUN|nr:hypothetical protein XA68_16445 [Ophiocordyceps unilateralis]
MMANLAVLSTSLFFRNVVGLVAKGEDTHGLPRNFILIPTIAAVVCVERVEEARQIIRGHESASEVGLLEAWPMGSRCGLVRIDRGDFDELLWVTKSCGRQVAIKYCVCLSRKDTEDSDLLYEGE